MPHSAEPLQRRLRRERVPRPHRRGVGADRAPMRRACRPAPLASPPPAGRPGRGPGPPGRRASARCRRRCRCRSRRWRRGRWRAAASMSPARRAARSVGVRRPAGAAASPGPAGRAPAGTTRGGRRRAIAKHRSNSSSNTARSWWRLTRLAARASRSSPRSSRSRWRMASAASSTSLIDTPTPAARNCSNSTRSIASTASPAAGVTAAAYGVERQRARTEADAIRPPAGRLVRLGVVLPDDAGAARQLAALCDRAGVDVVWAPTPAVAADVGARGARGRRRRARSRRPAARAPSASPSAGPPPRARRGPRSTPASPATSWGGSRTVRRRWRRSPTTASPTCAAGCRRRPTWPTSSPSSRPWWSGRRPRTTPTPPARPTRSRRRGPPGAQAEHCYRWSGTKCSGCGMTAPAGGVSGRRGGR